MKKRVCYWMLGFMLLAFIFSSNPVRADTVSPPAYNMTKFFCVEGDTILLGSGGRDTDLKARSLLMNRVTIASEDRVNEFLNTNSTPWITTSIKYIVEDGSNGDGRDEEGDIRWRYMYCIEHEKDPPFDQTLSWKGWENRYVNHILYYGAVYYYETSRDASHSTGNWRYDYLATHMAITIATGQYSLEAVTNSIRKSPASSADEEKLIRAITNMIQDAYSADGLKGWDNDGWFRMDTKYSAFSLEAASKDWTQGKDGNYYTEWISPVLTSQGGFYANADITRVTHELSDDVTIEKKYPDSIHSPYRLVITDSQYEDWEKEGKTITSFVTIRIPSHWGAATYTSGNSKLQDVCILSYSSAEQYTTFSDDISFTIPKKQVELFPYKLNIKKENTDGIVLQGAEFTLYSDSDRTITVDKQTSDSEGNLTFYGLQPGEVYYLQETSAPAGYRLSADMIKFCAWDTSDKGEFQFQMDDVLYDANAKNTDDTVRITGTVSDYTIHIKVINEPGMILPSTGSYMVFILLFVGVLCMMTALRKAVWKTGGKL